MAKTADRTAPSGPLADHLLTGEGEPLLLIHGFSATWHAWQPIVDRLGDDFEILAPTLAGHTGGPPLGQGDSISLTTDDLERALDSVGWESAHIAGFSLGGWLALELAKRGRARTVTAISPGGARTESERLERWRIRTLFGRLWMSALGLGPGLERMCRRPGFRRFALRDQMADGALLSPREAAELIDRFRRTPVFARFLREIGSGPSLDGLDSVDVPVRILWGDRDAVLPQRTHEPFFRAELPGARFETLAGAGHVPFWEAGDEVAAAVRECAAQGLSPDKLAADAALA